MLSEASPTGAGCIFYSGVKRNPAQSRLILSGMVRGKKRSPGHVWIVSGPSGSGKTSLCDALLSDRFWRKRLAKSVSYTTRPMRSGEKNGKDYYHISNNEFLKLLKRREFLESEKIFGFYYGTPKKFVRATRLKGKDILFCIDVKGAHTIKSIFKKNATSIFISPPGLSALSERLAKRSTENKKAIRMRLRRVKMELTYAKSYDYIVFNDDFKTAFNNLKTILAVKKRELNKAMACGA